MKRLVEIIALITIAIPLLGEEIRSVEVNADLSSSNLSSEVWKNAKKETIILTAQPMALPRPKVTTTEKVTVQSVHNSEWIAFRLKWKDTDKSEAGRLGQFSDAVAVQFPVKEGDPPPIFMGAKDSPVHIYHWRAQYEIDEKVGIRTTKDLYPNAELDMYPLEFKDHGKIAPITEAQREVFLPGRAAGNPQSYRKLALDEIFAEGFGTSEVAEKPNAIAFGKWEKGQWTVVISRPLKPNRKTASKLQIGKENYMAFAVWQGGKLEVGARKSVTMAWAPLQIMPRTTKGENRAR